MQRAILGDGSIISRSTITDSIIGVRAVVGRDTVIEDTVVMGATRFGDPERQGGRVPIGIGRGSHIKNAILDLNAGIGHDCQLMNEAGIEELETENYSIKGGIIVVPRGAEIEPGTVI